ncbi:4'-phosphopantetheinyl transferase superfamily protein [Paenarthrobacter sp. Z7-10]|uniref:4'-phosphopantetheinyl transferase family protein n=1 Tax=Paenarthrobacter sp. Z7-10 TaxID=2787635 RepID=UPI0022A9C9D9|nr:4'-phosphopantetheinyl transferase superfamily protein [Paenarthrobacter sp. Z7-10]MCZ2402279.1 4'-phosphopantetheinyl transferase superfamily protein [Paenarthrobacter sp. Z7-10]
MSPSGAGHRVEYLITTVSKFDAAAPASTLAPLLPESEHSAAARFRQARDGQAYTAAHVLFRLMAARWLGTDPGRAAELEVKRHCRSCGGAHGKPRIDGVELSLSRSSDAVMVAAAPAGCAIGADLERIPAELFAGFDNFALSTAELASVSHSDISGRIRLWVAKEAALKATSHGLALDPHTLSIEPTSCGTASTVLTGHLPTGIEPTVAKATGTEPTVAPEPWTAVVRCTATKELDGTNIAWLPAPDGYLAALATAGTPAVTRLDLAELMPVLTRAG